MKTCHHKKHSPRAFFCVLTILLVGTPIAAAESSFRFPSPDWPRTDPVDVDLDSNHLAEAMRYSLSAGGSGLIIRNGQAVLRWGDQKNRYDIKSATKSFGATMLGIALTDDKVSLNDLASQHHPSFGVPPDENAKTGWLQKITLAHLATQTAGFDKPGGYQKLLFAPGSHWHYSDSGPNWLAECLTLAYGRDLQDVMFERVFSQLGISRDDLQWRKNQYRDHQINGIERREFGAGIHANVEALSRLGYLYLRDGRWKNDQLLSNDFVRLASGAIDSVVGVPEWTADSQGNASDHYGLLWWNNADGSLRRIPRDAFWAWGLYDSLIVVIPSLDLVVVRGGERRRDLARKENANHYDVLAPLLEPIVAATGKQIDNASLPTAPYPASKLIIGIDWAPVDSIVRQAKGSDNWPITWGDDDLLYTAYGDGWGFEPVMDKKLSLGLATIHGDPPNFRGVNIHSTDAEKEGQGANGQKASGMLMVDGVLYMMVRNADNSQLAWSEDHGVSWKSADWKWTTSFGCPTFLNFCKNYAGGPADLDDYVYMFSHDNDNAYEPADRMVLARVPKDQLQQRNAYEFCGGVDPTSGSASWTKDIEQRGAVFEHSGKCYRSGITYNAGLQRFLWCQTLPTSIDERGPRFQGGFGIYEATKPWGPWKTVYYTTDWDVGPGETSSFPTKWISADGKTVHLVFSGDDHFSVRQAMLVTNGTYNLID